MKKPFHFSWIIVFCLVYATQVSGQLKGAWKQTSSDGKTTMLVCSDDYLMIARYKEKEFLYTEGGIYTLSGGTVTYKSEFNSADTSKVGKTVSVNINFSGNKLSVEGLGDWQRTDEGKTPAAAVYRITGRMGNDNQITSMQRGARKTLKMLTDTRFQWVAINPETKQFSGTGGGSYTIKDGKYTETIDFFSRDNNRVGASLSFDYELKEGKDWHHSGLSSAGAKIYEVWSKEK
ncbi:membrane or secreted protein [Runella sp.]|uniref:membrane or secreted protein n=1 Tax=Runella sp. TaxID=1960881 RepID=UPI003D137EF1